MGNGWRLALVICAALLILAPVQAQRSAVITAQPGDVVPIEGNATVFGKTWKHLIGIDLEMKPGTYSVKLDTGTDAGLKTGSPTTMVLTILPKQFLVRRLNVPADFVTPPPDALSRIAEDNRKTAAIWRRMTARKWTGAFLLPVDGQPTSNFGTRSYFNGQRRSPHAGIDFLNATGTPIRAANHGTVVLAEPLYFTGNTIIIDYGDGLYSLYAHLSEFRAHEGDAVAPDTVVGLVGATGRVTGAHLHWAVRLQGAHVDPLSLIHATR